MCYIVSLARDQPISIHYCLLSLNSAFGFCFPLTTPPPLLNLVKEMGSMKHQSPQLQEFHHHPSPQHGECESDVISSHMEEFTSVTVTSLLLTFLRFLFLVIFCILGRDSTLINKLSHSAKLKEYIHIHKPPFPFHYKTSQVIHL